MQFLSANGMFGAELKNAGLVSKAAYLYTVALFIQLNMLLSKYRMFKKSQIALEEKLRRSDPV